MHISASYFVDLIPSTNILSKKSVRQKMDLFINVQGIENGFKMIFTKPFGYNNPFRSPGYGFLFLTDLYGLIRCFYFNDYIF